MAKESKITFLAVGELVQAAAHIHGITGPVMFNVCRPEETAWCGNCGDCWMCRDEDEYAWCGPFDTDPAAADVNSAPTDEEFFYAQSFC